MREGWTYKKLGEVCDLYQPKTISSDMLVSDGDYLVYGANGIIGRYNQYNHEDSEVLVTCRGATCGTINISAPFSWINGNAMVVHPKNEDLSKKYLVYALRGINMSDVINGAAQPQITRQSLSPKKFPVPPLSEQQRIVSELDLLSSIIEKKKAQLKEYDQLAQSIFYDMFGDPVENKKGWEQQPFYSICKSLFAGGDVPKNNFSKTKTEKYKVPIISNGINDKAIYGYTNIAKVEEESLTISGRGTIGYCAIRKEPFFPVIRLIVATPKQDIILPIVLKYIIDSLNLKGEGVAIPQLTIPKVKNELIILPPLFLQQQFAEKTEAIEKQKELIMQSLTEMESLYNSRIDFWFNC